MIKLSIIISNRNDLVMLNITLNSAIEACKSLPPGCNSEIVLVDNSDENCRSLMGVVIPSGFQRKNNVRVFYQDTPCFTSARMLAAEKARGEYILCVDSHVLFGHSLLKNSVDFMDRHAQDDNLGFGHPPIRWAHQGPAGIKHTLKISPNGTPNGGWDRAYTSECPMYWKFMPWICKREWFLETLKGYGTHATAQLSWGGAELLMQMKSLMLGYTNWSIISDPLIHIGPYTPEVIKTGQYRYRTYAASGNYPHGFGILVAYYILGGDVDGYRHAKLGEEQFFNRHKINVDQYWEKAKEVGKAEHHWLMENKKIDYLELLANRPWES